MNEMHEAVEDLIKTLKESIKKHDDNLRDLRIRDLELQIQHLQRDIIKMQKYIVDKKL